MSFYENFHCIFIILSPSNTGCNYEGTLYSYNETWNETSCKTCTCTPEGVQCTYKNCTQLSDCSVTYIPEGECCPVCFQPTNVITPNDNLDDVLSGCMSESGAKYEEGQRWEPGPCRRCRCEDGEISCAEKMCDTPKCDDGVSYYIPEGECCPICEKGKRERERERERGNRKRELTRVNADTQIKFLGISLCKSRIGHMYYMWFCCLYRYEIYKFATSRQSSLCFV